jgi:hypothetical protein
MIRLTLSSLFSRSLIPFRLRLPLKRKLINP